MSPSAYDTAWVAMVPLSGEYSGIQQQPRFPECLEWIVKNQKADGSWGVDPGHPNLVKDSLSCTVSCLLALRKWNIGHELVPRVATSLRKLCKRKDLLERKQYYTKPHREMSMSEEYTSLCKYACLVCRILNDLKSYKREKEEHTMNCISVQIAEGVSEEAAILKAEQLVEYYTRKALEMVNQTEGSILPRECKQLFWKTCKIARCLYSKSGGDEFSSPQEMAKDMKGLLWEPIQHPSLSR